MLKEKFMALRSASMDKFRSSTELCVCCKLLLLLSKNARDFRRRSVDRRSTFTSLLLLSKTAHPFFTNRMDFLAWIKMMDAAADGGHIAYFVENFAALVDCGEALRCTAVSYATWLHVTGEWFEWEVVSRVHFSGLEVLLFCRIVFEKVLHMGGIVRHNMIVDAVGVSCHRGLLLAAIVATFMSWGDRCVRWLYFGGHCKGRRALLVVVLVSGGDLAMCAGRIINWIKVFVWPNCFWGVKLTFDSISRM